MITRESPSINIVKIPFLSFRDLLEKRHNQHLKKDTDGG